MTFLLDEFFQEKHAPMKSLCPHLCIALCARAGRYHQLHEPVNILWAGRLVLQLRLQAGQQQPHPGDILLLHSSMQSSGNVHHQIKAWSPKLPHITAHHCDVLCRSDM